jgi:hypothetical protein
MLQAFKFFQNQHSFKSINRLIFLAICLSFNGLALADKNNIVPEKPIIVIGGSWSNGDLPLNSELEGVLGGMNVGLGSYLDLGKALIRDHRLSGFVINEGQAGGSTLAHPDCGLFQCATYGWISMDEQFERALRRVSSPALPQGVYNSKYVVITAGNDCLHSNAFGIPQAQTTPCSLTEMNEYIDRMIALGQKVINTGLTPVFTSVADIKDLDLSLQAPFFYWFIDDTSYTTLAELYEMRLSSELPGSVYLDVWKNFTHIGDGLHPTNRSSKKAAKIIAKYIRANP